MKKFIPFAALFISATFMISCHKERVKPSSDITTQTHALGNYDQVKVSDAIDADVTFGTGVEEVVVDANANIHSYIVKEVISGTLYIRIKDNVRFNGPTHINVHIYSNDFSAATISGASELSILNPWVESAIDVKISGASSFSGELNTADLNLDASGASSIDISGTANYSTLELSGASSLVGSTYVTDYLTAELSGASKIRLTVNGTLNLDLSGASSVKYYGTGTIDQITATGSSTVEHL